MVEDIKSLIELVKSISLNLEELKIQFHKAKADTMKQLCAIPSRCRSHQRGYQRNPPEGKGARCEILAPKRILEDSREEGEGLAIDGREQGAALEEQQTNLPREERSKEYGQQVQGEETREDKGVVSSKGKGRQKEADGEQVVEEKKRREIQWHNYPQRQPHLREIEDKAWGLRVGAL
eukprot:Gb_06513 [translate_table: standard]